ncbi:MAG TPA: asparagine synthase-related protein [Gemmatimonadaceae bacterium]|nr:asparagine synthase-related protein [Gemmatimonadaceae bacterium]
MSAIVAVINGARAARREELATRALAAMGPRGAEISRVVSCGDATLGIASDAWETPPGREGSVAIASEAGIVVVADAALYYRTDLLRALRASDARPLGTTAAHVILAAYRAWGEQCAGRIEGDFAFIVWDSVARRLVAARDVGATRPLFYTETRDGLLLASTVAGLTAAGAEPALNLAHVGEVAAGLALDETSTCLASIDRIPAAHTLSFVGDARPALTPHWTPPTFETGRRLTLEDGAVVLRELLTRAVQERLDARSPSSVWLSGGWDSPAVFGAGMLATGGDVDRVRAVSITYPVGDPGREDELITSIAKRWGATPHWIDSTGISLLADLRQRAAHRDEPFAHAFEHWNRALARGSRAVDSHVALHGNGGDQLFQVSLVYLADLARSGRLLAMARECRARGVRDARTLFRWAIQPLLSRAGLRAATALRGGRPLRAYLERDVPPWINADFARRNALHERARATPSRRRGESLAAFESRYYLTAPYFPRVYACVSGLAREEGVEVRSPLLDPRVIAFAAERPSEERAWRRETKRALRAAMRGIIPDDVLAPRAVRTGTTGRLFGRAMRSAGADLVAEATRHSRLAELGIVDPDALQRGWQTWQANGDGNLGVTLFLTLQAEFWTRAHDGSRALPNGAPASAAMALAGALS